MINLYHGSPEIIKEPKILDKQRLLDFGKGFYTTTNQNQARRWAQIKQKREGNNAKAFVSVYQFNDQLLTDSTLNIKKFEEANEQWLDFIVRNRSADFDHGYDMVIGPVANDTLYQTLALYESGILTKPETIIRLKVHDLFNQFAFNSMLAIKHLKYHQSFEL